MDSFIKDNKRKRARKFYLSYCYTVDLSSYADKRVNEFASDIQPNEFIMFEITEFISIASITTDENNNFTAKLYDKHDALCFCIVDFLSMLSNIPSASAYGV